MQVLQPLPEGWECAPSSQEVERPRAIFFFPPPGWQPQRITLAEACDLQAMADVPFEKLAALLALSAGRLGGVVEAALGSLRSPGSIGVGEALALAGEASTFLRHCLVDLERGLALGTTAGAAPAAASAAAAAAAGASDAVGTGEGNEGGSGSEVRPGLLEVGSCACRSLRQLRLLQLALQGPGTPV